MYYYVFRTLHNAETGGEDYQKPDRYETLEDASKKFHDYLSTFIAYGKLDSVSVVLMDSLCNTLKREVWTAPAVEPEPIEEVDIYE